MSSTLRPGPGKSRLCRPGLLLALGRLLVASG
ncbi:c-type cytochrome, partial [Pseudomonas aeruginosa]